MSFRVRSSAIFCLLVALWMLAGCGDSAPALVPVTGKVTLDGSPLTKGSIRFQPDKDKGNTFGSECIGEVGADGIYKLTTVGKDGAPAGWYKVSVNSSSSTEIPDSTKPLAIKSPIAAKYNDPSKSGLAVEVVASAPAGTYDFKVSAK